MATEVVMPALGMAQETGRLIRWLKREGEAVVKGEPLMEVETDKATVEVEAPASGILGSISAAEGDDIEVGRAIALILAAGESGHILERPRFSPATAEREPDTARARTVPTAAVGLRPAASPKARRLAAERGVALASLTGGGPGGAVLEEDVLQAGGAEPALWRAMADNVTRGWKSAPHFFVIREVDASNLSVRRAAMGDGVTFTDLIVKAVADALRLHPRVNGQHRMVNVGLAVAVPDGLIVPVIHEADKLEVGEIAARRSELLASLKTGKLRSSDLGDGSFTVSNLGMYGVDLFTAIITEGQAGILAVGRIADRVVARDGSAVVRPTMLMSLSCDHRLVDGARAAEFMQTLAGALESP